MNTVQQLILLNEFETALEEEQFYLEWQPQIDSRKNNLSGLETLVRWEHPRYGQILPEQFIPLLEQNAKITSLSLWVLRQAILSAPKFQQRYPEIDISINLSVHDLMSKQLIPAIDMLLEETGKKIAQHLVLEITESVHMEDNSTILTCIDALQQRGFHISIDDFGAGYASFGYLQNLPINELKIDRRYTQQLNEHNSQVIVESIIDLASRLNMRTVVEGIETEHQQKLLTRLGAHRLQGWQMGRPTSQQDILASKFSHAA